MSALINSGIGYYESTSKAVKKSFELKHKGVPIFERYFNGESTAVVGIGTSVSLISLPNHNFISGEEVVYDYSYDFLHEPIGIVTTNVAGVGLTDILPSKLYVIKVDAQYIRLTDAPEKATVENPEFLQITSVGVGTLHRIYSNDVDNRLLLTLDNLIQSPVVGTGVTTDLTDFDVNLTTDVIGVATTKNLFNGDLIRINDEIMEIKTVAYTNDNYLLVERPILGTTLGLHTIGDTLEKLSGNYTVSRNTLHFADAPFGVRPTGAGETTGQLQSDFDYIGINTSSKFSGRSFIRSAVPGATNKAYSDNYVFDDISEGFTGVATNFNLTVDQQEVSGFSLDSAIVLIRDIFQSPKVESNVTISGNYEITAGTATTQADLSFIGLQDFVGDDVNSSGVPVGGVIAAVGSSAGSGYQKLKPAAGGAIIVGGVISDVKIFDGGSGYRTSVQNPINVYARTGNFENDNKVKIGEAVIGTDIETVGRVVSVNITDGGSGYSETIDPPRILFDDPLNYESIPLVYSSASQSGVGTGAKADIIVGQGSSIISFNMREYGYGYKPGDILTIPIGQSNGGVEGLTDFVDNVIGVGTAIAAGITTTLASPIVINDGVTVLVEDTATLISGDNVYKSIVDEFQIYVDKTYSDKFSAWSFGELEVFDSPENLFDGVRTTFPLTIDGTLKSIIGDVNIDIQAALLVFLNGVLQVPGEGYLFDGGSTFTFTEPPNGPLEGTQNTGDTCQVIFYRGTKNVDVLDVDITETIKKGDRVQVFGDDIKLRQEDRLVNLVDSTTSLLTDIYAGVGIVSDSSLVRSLIWKKQTEDLFIDGNVVGKDRPLYEPRINPFTNIIQSVGTAVSTSIYVEGARTYFDNFREDITGEVATKIEIVDIAERSRAKGTVEVSILGEVDNVIIDDGGSGYGIGQVPIIFTSPVGVGTTGQAKGYGNATNGEITSVTITDGGSGYSETNPPEIFFEKPTGIREEIEDVSYVGDFGVITDITPTTIGVGSTGLTFNLYVPEGSPIRDPAITGVAITVSGLRQGDYFTVQNSYVGSGVKSVDLEGNIIGVGSEYIDNIYQVYDVSFQRKEFTVNDLVTGFEIFNSPGIINEGVTVTVDDGATILIDEFSTTEVTVRIDQVYPDLASVSPALFLGDYSWGRIDTIRRRSPKTFTSFYNDGVAGIDTSPVVRRINPLRSSNYVL